MRVLKFGGTSVGDPARIREVVRLVGEAGQSERALVVVSAFASVTNRLIVAATRASRGESWADVVEGIAERHLAAASELAMSSEIEDLRGLVTQATDELRGQLQGISLIRECTPRTLDGILSHGERMSSLIVAAGLRSAGHAAKAHDARSLVRTDKSFGSARVDLERCVEDYFGDLILGEGRVLVLHRLAVCPPGEPLSSNTSRRKPLRPSRPLREA